MDNTKLKEVKLKEVEIYADGATRKNPGKSGWGTILLYYSNGKEYRREIKGGVRKSTNNRMELRAIISGLNLLKEPCEVTVYTDSQYVTNPFNLGWLKRWEEKNWEDVKNLDLWQELLKHCQIHTVRFVWVKGHAGNLNQERADYLANLGLMEKEPIIDLVYEQVIAQENLKLSA